MPDIKDSVGDGCANLVHDVALVQAMLRIVKNAKGVPYLNNNYDGNYGLQTKTAITDFQTDQKLAGAVKAPPPGSETLGVIKAGSATLKKLVDVLPPQYSIIRIIEKTSTVYLEGDGAAAAASQGKIAAHPDLDVSFRANVASLVELMFKTHKIALSIAPKGARRTFQEQADLPPGVTKAGPGESNHNFGRAVDIGFNGIKWLAGDGTIVQDDWWFNKLVKVSAAKTNLLWGARDAVADLVNPNLYRIGAWDQPHLQSFSDSKVSMGRSLVALLNAAGQTKWAHGGGSPNHYKSDLGLGGKTYDVGTAKEIWAGNANVTKLILADAQSAKLKKAVAEADIKDADLADMKTKLKADFQAAETNWKLWKPVS